MCVTLLTIIGTIFKHLDHFLRNAQPELFHLRDLEQFLNFPYIVLRSFTKCLETIINKITRSFNIVKKNQCDGKIN